MTDETFPADLLKEAVQKAYPLFQNNLTPWEKVSEHDKKVVSRVIIEIWNLDPRRKAFAELEDAKADLEEIQRIVEQRQYDLVELDKLMV